MEDTMSELKGVYRAMLSTPASNAAGGVLALANPEGADVVVERLILNITTAAENSITVDAGITSGSTVASADNLIDGLAVNGEKVADNFGDGGSNGKTRQKWGSDTYLTVTASGSAADMAGYAYVDYFRV